MKKLLKSLPLKDLYRGQNVRIPGVAHTEELYTSIQKTGLQEAPWVFQEDKNRYKVIRGHLRTECLEKLQEEEPSRYKELFPKGIQCIVISEITPEEAELLKIDHGTENPLMHPMEVQLCMNLMLDGGATEKTIAVELSGLMQRVSPMKVEAKNALTLLRKDVTIYRETGRLEDIPEKQKQISDLLLDYHKGKIQNGKAIWRCPHIVMATMWYKATGARDWSDQIRANHIGKNDYLPTKLTVAQCANKLWPAFRKDLKIKNEEGTCPYNKRVPGPNFNAAWEAICEASKKRESEGHTPAVRSLSATELKEEEAKWLSTGFKMLTQHHRRLEGVDPGQLATLDEVAYFAEILAKRAPKEWAEVLELAKELEKGIIATQKEVEAAEKEAANG